MSICSSIISKTQASKNRWFFSYISRSNYVLEKNEKRVLGRLKRSCAARRELVLPSVSRFENVIMIVVGFKFTGIWSRYLDLNFLFMKRRSLTELSPMEVKILILIFFLTHFSVILIWKHKAMRVLSSYLKSVSWSLVSRPLNAVSIQIGVKLNNPHIFNFTTHV